MVKISFSTFVFNIYRLLLKVFSRGDSFSHDEAEVLLSCVIDRCLYLFVNLIDIIREAQITETPLSIIEFSLTALPNYSFQSESSESPWDISNWTIKPSQMEDLLQDCCGELH